MTPLLHDRSQLWPHQRELLGSFDRRVLIDGGVGTGKTAACVVKVRLHCLMNPGQRIGISAQTQQQIERVIRDEWIAQIDHTKYRTVGGVNPRIEMADCQSTLPFIALEHRAGKAEINRRGNSLSGYLITEASAVTHEVDYDGLDARVRLFGPEPDEDELAQLLADREASWPNRSTTELEKRYGESVNGLGYSKYLRLIDTNPGSPHHWLYKRYIDKGSDQYAGKYAPKHIRVVSTPETSRYGKAWFEEKKLEFTPVEWMRKIEGKWVGNDGLAFPDFQMDTHVSDFELNPEWSYYWSVDFGFRNPFCVLLIGVDSDNIVHICDEYYLSGKIVTEHAKALVTWNEDTKPSAVITDHDPNAYTTLMRTIRADGLEVRHIATKKPSDQIRVQQGTARIALKEDGKPGMLVHARCKNFLRELGGLEWERTSEGRADKERLVDVNNHSTDAWMYAEASLLNRRYKP